MLIATAHRSHCQYLHCPDDYRSDIYKMLKSLPCNEATDLIICILLISFILNFFNILTPLFNKRDIRYLPTYLATYFVRRQFNKIGTNCAQATVGLQ